MVHDLGDQTLALLDLQENVDGELNVLAVLDVV